MWVLPLGPTLRGVRRCTRRESRIRVLGGRPRTSRMKGGRSRVVVTSKKTRRPSRRTCTRETGRAHCQRTAIIDAKSKSTVDIAHASTPRAELHLPRVRRDSSRPEQTHTFQIGVGTPGHVCRCTVFFSRPFLRQVWVPRSQTAQELADGSRGCPSRCRLRLRMLELGGCAERP